MYLQKVLRKKILGKKFISVDVLKVTDGNNRIQIRIRIQYRSQRYGSADPDPDPYKNFMDPKTLV
jgi:hypothetical protein